MKLSKGCNQYKGKTDLLESIKTTMSEIRFAEVKKKQNRWIIDKGHYIKMERFQKLILCVCYIIEVDEFLIMLSYLPTPPLGQDMTQGQFLSGV